MKVESVLYFELKSCLNGVWYYRCVSVCVRWGVVPRFIAASKEASLCSHNSLSYSNGTWKASVLSILIRCTCNQSIILKQPTDTLLYGLSAVFCACDELDTITLIMMKIIIIYFYASVSNTQSRIKDTKHTHHV